MRTRVSGVHDQNRITSANFYNWNLRACNLPFVLTSLKQPALASLNILGNTFGGRELKAISEAILKSDSLRILVIGFDVLNGNGLAALKTIMKKTNWVHLNLHFATLNERGSSILQQGLGANPHLRHLKITVHNHKEGALVSLVSHLSEIKSLCLRVRHLTMDDAIAIRNLLRIGKLEAFGLSASNWTDLRVACLFDGIQQAKRLRILDLRSNDFGTLEDIESNLIQAFAGCHNLTGLGVDKRNAAFLARVKQSVKDVRTYSLEKTAIWQVPHATNKIILKERAISMSEARRSKGQDNSYSCLKMPRAVTVVHSTPDILSNPKALLLAQKILKQNVLSAHAIQRMQERCISLAHVCEALCNGEVSITCRGRRFYSKATGLSVILSEKGKQIITTYFRGSSASVSHKTREPIHTMPARRGKIKQRQFIAASAGALRMLAADRFNDRSKLALPSKLSNTDIYQLKSEGFQIEQFQTRRITTMQPNCSDKIRLPVDIPIEKPVIGLPKKSIRSQLAYESGVFYIKQTRVSIICKRRCREVKAFLASFMSYRKLAASFLDHITDASQDGQVAPSIIKELRNAGININPSHLLDWVNRRKSSQDYHLNKKESVQARKTPHKTPKKSAKKNPPKRRGKPKKIADRATAYKTRRKQAKRH
ncbi:MAG: DUF4258 domain-containing protein [Chlamydiales bacterium]|nr:DUF4258 domain-containing protein [Chlamydiales bacterium]